MKVFSVLGFKGGTTKTSISANLAAAFARAGLRTVLLDMDGQSNSAVMMRCKPEPGIYNLLLADHEFKDVLRPVTSKFSGLDCPLFVVPSSPSQFKVDINEETPALIGERIPELAAWADVVVIDTAPGSTQTHAGVYYASDYIILPTTLQMLSLHSLAVTLSFLESAAREGAEKGYQPGEILGIVPNCYSTNTKVERSNEGYLRGKYDERFHVFEALRYKTVWNQASQKRQCIYAYAPADDYSARRESRTAMREFNAIFEVALEKVERVVV
jgi:chromosome partitioning protein